MKDKQHHNSEHLLKYYFLHLVEKEIENICFHLLKHKFSIKEISFFNEADFHQALVKRIKFGVFIDVSLRSHT